MIELENVYSPHGGVRDEIYEFLLKVLSERDEITNISHVEMPDWGDHCWFVLSRPYLEWWVIVAGGVRVGSCYVSKKHEIGLFILKAYRRKGYGTKALDKIKERYEGCILFANINPKNSPSISLFEGEGFEHIQNTYRLKP